LYAHLSRIAVSEGENITKGDVVGYEGTTGFSTGPHLHFEVRVNGKPNNPLNYVQYGRLPAVGKQQKGALSAHLLLITSQRKLRRCARLFCASRRPDLPVRANSLGEPGRLRKR